MTLEEIYSVPEERPTFIRVGDRLMIDGNEYLVCSPSSGSACLINVSGGIRRGEIVAVRNLFALSKNEVENLVRGNTSKVHFVSRGVKRQDL